MQVAGQIRKECAWAYTDRYLRAARVARADIMEWEAAELEAKATALRSDASKLRSESHVAE